MHLEKFLQTGFVAKTNETERGSSVYKFITEKFRLICANAKQIVGFKFDELTALTTQKIVVFGG